jgi:hypothetical protein
MIIDIERPSRAAGVDLPDWSAAEVLDAPLPDQLTLRAVVLRVGAHKWQWSISSLDGDRGEQISAGIEKSAAAARLMATSEIAKCLESPLD